MRRALTAWWNGSGAGRSALREAAKGVLLAVGLVVAVYSLLELIPGDPVRALLGDRSTEQARAALTAQLRLEVPWPQRMVEYLALVFLHGDLGQSFASGIPVSELLMSRVGATVGIAVNGIMIATALGTVFAIVAAYQRGRTIDHLVRIVTTVGLSMPAFWVGILLIVLFAQQLRWLPAGGIDWSTPATMERSLLLPGLVSALPIIPLITRSLRLEIVKVLDSDHVLFAQAAGITPSRILLTRVLPASMVPMIAIVALNFSYLLGGSVIVERVFGISGLGGVLFDAISARDVPVIQGVVLLTGAAVIVVNAMARILIELLTGKRGGRSTTVDGRATPERAPA